MRPASSDVGNDLQLERRRTLQVERVVLHLPGRTARAERVLLPHEEPARRFPRGSPRESELLRSLCLVLLEDEVDAADPLRLVEEDPDRLRSRFRRPPAVPAAGDQRGLDRVAGVLGRDLDPGETFEVEEASPSAGLTRRGSRAMTCLRMGGSLPWVPASMVRPGRGRRASLPVEGTKPPRSEPAAVPVNATLVA